MIVVPVILSSEGFAFEGSLHDTEVIDERSSILEMASSYPQVIWNNSSPLWLRVKIMSYLKVE